MKFNKTRTIITLILFSVLTSYILSEKVATTKLCEYLEKEKVRDRVGLNNDEPDDDDYVNFAAQAWNKASITNFLDEDAKFHKAKFTITDDVYGVALTAALNKYYLKTQIEAEYLKGDYTALITAIRTAPLILLEKFCLNKEIEKIVCGDKVGHELFYSDVNKKYYTDANYKVVFDTGAPKSCKSDNKPDITLSNFIKITNKCGVDFPDLDGIVGNEFIFGFGGLVKATDDGKWRLRCARAITTGYPNNADGKPNITYSSANGWRTFITMPDALVDKNKTNQNDNDLVNPEDFQKFTEQKRRIFDTGKAGFIKNHQKINDHVYGSGILAELKGLTCDISGVTTLVPVAKKKLLRGLDNKKKLNKLKKQ